jgi:hypothetical protein
MNCFECGKNTGKLKEISPNYLLCNCSSTRDRFPARPSNCDCGILRQHQHCLDCGGLLSDRGTNGEKFLKGFPKLFEALDDTKIGVFNVKRGALFFARGEKKSTWGLAPR